MRSEIEKLKNLTEEKKKRTEELTKALEYLKKEAPSQTSTTKATSANLSRSMKPSKVDVEIVQSPGISLLVVSSIDSSCILFF